MKYFLFLLLLIPVCCPAQRYWVFFDGKGTSVTDTLAFDEHMRIRRRTLSIPWDEKDAPVDSHYIRRVSDLVDAVGYSSRWLNAVAVTATETEIEEVRRLPFVREVQPLFLQVQASGNPIVNHKEDLGKLARYQTLRLGAPVFRTRGLSGKGVRIAILDAGFYGADDHPAFQHIRQRQGFIKTYDFIRRKEDVFTGSVHGTMVLSCIAGISDTLALGLAADAEFLLARTEYLWADTHNDEDRWIAALEWAEQNGADLVNSSLGYTDALHFRYQLNGQLPVCRAANIAAAKGMLVINAAGNEYNNTWKYISVPADADSVLTVGATDPESDLQTDFSSMGPTADGRLKPNVCAPGICAVIDGSKLVKAEGTSFAAPLVTGFAACLLQQSKGKLNALQLKQAIEHSAHLYPYFDYAHGYGIPQASYYPRKNDAPKNFSIQRIDNDISVLPYPGVVKDSNDYKLLYFHIQGRSGYLVRYQVIELNERGPVSLYVHEGHEHDDQRNISPYYTDPLGVMRYQLHPGETLRIHLEGYTEEYIHQPAP